MVFRLIYSGATNADYRLLSKWTVTGFIIMKNHTVNKIITRKGVTELRGPALVCLSALDKTIGLIFSADLF